MADFVANCPISMPVRNGKSVDADFGGIMWSNDAGFVFEPTEDFIPRRDPPPMFWQEGG